MTVSIETYIDRSADAVWEIVGPRFDEAAAWIGGVVHSKALHSEKAAPNAPMEGRFCNFDENPNGFGANELIRSYDANNRTLTFEVYPVNAPRLLPLVKNHIRITVHEVNANQSKVVWEATSEYKPLAKLFSPLLNAGLSKAFTGILKDLKKYAEAQPAVLKQAA